VELVFPVLGRTASFSFLLIVSSYFIPRLTYYLSHDIVKEVLTRRVLIFQFLLDVCL